MIDYYDVYKNKTGFTECLHKSRGKCTQGSITKNQIETLLEEELKKISISKDFYAWSLNSLKQDEKDKEENENVIRNLKKRKSELDNRVSGLINLRADGEINSEKFNASVRNTEKEIASIEFEIEKTQRDNFEWFEQRDKDYNFALEALEKFKNGDDSVKTTIARKLSSNLTLLDKKLDITTKSSLLDVKKDYSVYRLKDDART